MLRRGAIAFLFLISALPIVRATLPPVPEVGKVCPIDITTCCDSNYAPDAGKCCDIPGKEYYYKTDPNCTQQGTTPTTPTTPNGGLGQGQVVVPATSTATSDATMKAFTQGLSADDATTAGKDINSYTVLLPDTAAGKVVNVNFPSGSPVSQIAATTTAHLSKFSIDTDVVDIYKHPALFKKQMIYDRDYPRPIPLPPAPTVEIIGMKVHGDIEIGGRVTTIPVTGPTGSASGSGLSGDNWMSGYYFQFRLPSEVIQSTTNKGFNVPTGSPDIFVHSESDLQHVTLLHYNYVTEHWDEVKTKSVGKCDLQMCVFVAGPQARMSYYAIVVENETNASQSSSATASPSTSTLCCSPAIMIFILTFITVIKK